MIKILFGKLAKEKFKEIQLLANKKWSPFMLDLKNKLMKNQILNGEKIINQICN